MDAFTGELFAGDTRTSADAMGIDAAAYSVELVDRVVYKLLLLTGPSVTQQVPGLVPREFGRRNEWVAHTKLYAQRLHTRIQAERGEQATEAFMAGASAFSVHCRTTLTSSSMQGLTVTMHWVHTWRSRATISPGRHCDCCFGQMAVTCGPSPLDHSEKDPMESKHPLSKQYLQLCPPASGLF